jgi:putative Holliday junction resolvase
MGRILAVDYGLKRIGLAVSDETQTVAQGLKTLDCGRKTPADVIDDIKRVASNCEAELIILGYPLSLSGKPTARSKEVDAFRALLEDSIDVPVELVDERYTTALAHRYIEEGGKKARADRQPIDMVSAVIMLEDYLGTGERDLAGE